MRAAPEATDATRRVARGWAAARRWSGLGVAVGLAVAGALSGGGCTLVRLREESRAFYQASVLVGRVAAPPDWQGPVVVAATTQVQGRTVVAHHVRLHEPGGYELIVPDGRYTLVAFGDRDGDGRADPDEPGAVATSPVDVAGAGIVLFLDLTLEPGGAEAVRAALPSGAPLPRVPSTQVGALAELEAPALSAASGREGYWAPMEAFRRHGGNIYFLEPYDPERIPVLFVHGAAGSAQDWRAFFAHLDRERYQAWFFQYPSGAALDSMAHLLYWKLLNLQLRHRFEQLHVVAHSMGGLVVRRFLLDHGEQFPQLGRFISISTPWGGEAAAALGVERSPAVVPSWRDLQPEGEFLTDLFARPLPAQVSHTLLFGHRGGFSLLRPNTDGTVTLASQLRPAAQAEAQLVLGFDEDHTSILAAPSVLAQVNRLLDAAGRSNADAGAGAGGRVQTSLTWDEPDLTPRASVLALTLRPAPEVGPATGSPLVLLLAPGDAGHALGPIAPGTYEAQLVADAFRSTPARARVTIAPGGVTPLAFRLAAQGTLTGYVGAEGDATAYPAGSYRPPHPHVVIERLVLTGPAGSRTLVPRTQGDPELWTAYGEGRDDAMGAAFSFVALPAGDYELTLFARGYAPHVSRHRVVPGRATLATPLVLRPRR